MFPGAGFYGIGEILLTYANLPRYLPFPVAVQHGWQRFAHAFEASANPPEIWVWSPRIASELEAFYPKGKIRVIGSFYCYLIKTLGLDLSRERRGSICIPPHSSHFASTEYSVTEFARRLYELGDEYKPITVMLYYLDMNSHTVGEYEKFGFEVVSNGSLFGTDFLKNFVHNVYEKKHCLFSDLGSGVLFAADLGLDLFHIDIEAQVVNKGNIHITEEMISKVKSFDDDFLNGLNGEQLSLELGKAFVLTPEELRRLIIRNYFTWSFALRSVRRVIVGILRCGGLFRKKLK